MLAAFLQECLLLEHRAQRGISELRSACVQLVLSKSRICVELGTFPAKGLAATQQQGLLQTYGAFCPQIRVCVFILDLFVMSVVV